MPVWQVGSAERQEGARREDIRCDSQAVGVYSNYEFGHLSRGAGRAYPVAQLFLLRIAADAD